MRFAVEYVHLYRFDQGADDAETGDRTVQRYDAEHYSIANEMHERRRRHLPGPVGEVQS